MLQLVWRTVPATVSFAWVCTAAVDTHRPTAHPAKLPGNRRLSSGDRENTWSVRVGFQPSALRWQHRALWWMRVELLPCLPEVLVLQ